MWAFPADYESPSPKQKPTEVLMLTTAKLDLAPSLAQVTRYQALFDYFNESLFIPTFNERLPMPILNLSRKKGAAAFFAPSAWKDPMTGAIQDEISLVPEWTGRDPKEVLSSLVHEMAHQYDHIQGTAAKGAYHGKSWFRIMARLGLPGRALSKSMTKVTHDIKEGGAFDLAFKEMPKELILPFIGNYGFVVAKKKDNKMGKHFKYECPICGLIARAASGRNIICGECDERLHEVS
jgi:predicted SprT family Zn-dependent metalloprotease